MYFYHVISHWTMDDNRCGTFKDPHYSMAMSAKHRSKFVEFHRQTQLCRILRQERDT